MYFYKYFGNKTAVTLKKTYLESWSRYRISRSLKSMKSSLFRIIIQIFVFGIDLFHGKSRRWSLLPEQNTFDYIYCSVAIRMLRMRIVIFLQYRLLFRNVEKLNDSSWKTPRTIFAVTLWKLCCYKIYKTIE